VSVIEFENKAIAIVETSFVSKHSPSCLELYGTGGSLLVGGPEDQVRIVSDQTGGTLRGWVIPSQLPPALPRPIRLWVNGILEGTPIPFGLEEGTQLTALMQAAYASHQHAGVAVEVKR
jgi:1,5-anhydro-D-fructose reductase (1,5-anhydro-D-mannitol-forming)